MFFVFFAEFFVCCSFGQSAILVGHTESIPAPIAEVLYWSEAWESNGTAWVVGGLPLTNGNVANKCRTRTAAIAAFVRPSTHRKNKTLTHTAHYAQIQMQGV